MMTHRYGMALLTIGGVLLLTGCIQDSNDCEEERAVTCFDGEAESAEPCLDNEDGCREISEELCGEPRVRYCRVNFECPDVEPRCEEGTIGCDPADGDPECVRQVQGPGPCDATLFCRPAGMCDAEPASCDENETLTDNACGEDEPNCRAVTVCGETVYCRPDIVCQALPNCQPGEDAGLEPCAEDEEDCRAETECGQTIYCRPGEAACLAVPTCEPGEVESEDPCLPDNEACREETECGLTIYCRPDVQCDAYPVCENGYVGSEDACGDNEADCTPETACGNTIYCRPELVCQALPNCQIGEDGSFEPCGEDEAFCRAETECGQTIYCRTEGPPPVDQALEASVCPPIEIPMDPFGVLDTAIQGDVLYVTVEYSGGCADHEFIACPGDFREAEPVQLPLFLGHESNNDACEGIETQTLGIDLTWIRDQYRRQYNAENGEIIIDLGRPDALPQSYVF